MNITQEEQNALVQFFGTMHAQAKQTDNMIIGTSKHVNPISPGIKKQLEQALNNNNVQPRQQFEEPVYTPTAVNYASVPDTYTPPVELALPTAMSHKIVETLDSNIIDILKKINLNLSRIATTLEKQHGSTARVKNTKPD